MISGKETRRRNFSSQAPIAGLMAISAVSVSLISPSMMTFGS